MSSQQFHSKSISSTEDKMTGRAGIAPFAQYIKSIGLTDHLCNELSRLKKGKQGIALKDSLQSLLCWYMNGDSRHLSSFDDLKKDESTKPLFDVGEVPSSHAIKRLLGKCGFGNERGFRRILSKMFQSRLKKEVPKVVWLGLDSMVLDNDDSEMKMGVEPTYKGVKGFHPLQLTWNGMIIDAIFRRGSRHTHEFKLTSSMIAKAVREIKKTLGEEVVIIVSMDSGYLDQKLIRFLDEELKVGFLIGARVYNNFKEGISELPDEFWSEYQNGKKSWRYTEIEYKCDSWEKAYRAVFTQAQSKSDGQMILNFAMPTSLFVTNLSADCTHFTNEGLKSIKKHLTTEGLLKAYQKRGAEELCHRGLKDFGFEQLPFKRYGGNLAMYYLMVIAFDAFEMFKADCLEGVVSKTSYATTVRRKVIDIAGRLAIRSRQLYMRLNSLVLARLNFREIWKKSITPIPI